MTTLAPSFLIGASYFLQVRRTSIKSQMGSKFGSDQTSDCGFSVLECLENPHTLIMGEML